jgi:hypothetical protein
LKFSFSPHAPHAKLISKREIHAAKDIPSQSPFRPRPTPAPQKPPFLRPKPPKNPTIANPNPTGKKPRKIPCLPAAAVYIREREQFAIFPLPTIRQFQLNLLHFFACRSLLF